MGKMDIVKTTLLRTPTFDDLVAGRNLALLDPLGGLAVLVADVVPVTC
jgi:hypothetical protein